MGPGQVLEYALLTVVIKSHITFNVNYTLIMRRLIFFVENLDIVRHISENGTICLTS